MRLNSFGAPLASNLIMELLEVRCPIVNFHSLSFRVHKLLSSSSLVILLFLYILWMHCLKAVQPCQSFIWFSKAVHPYWVGSKQFNPVEFSSGAQGSPALPSFQLFQNCSRHVHTLGPIISAQVTPRDLCHLAWLC